MINMHCMKSNKVSALSLLEGCIPLSWSLYDSILVNSFPNFNIALWSGLKLKNGVLQRDIVFMCLRWVSWGRHFWVRVIIHFGWVILVPSVHMLGSLHIFGQNSSYSWDQSWSFLQACTHKQMIKLSMWTLYLKNIFGTLLVPTRRNGPIILI